MALDMGELMKEALRKFAAKGGDSPAVVERGKILDDGKPVGDFTKSTSAKVVDLGDKAKLDDLGEAIEDMGEPGEPDEVEVEPGRVGLDSVKSKKELPDWLMKALAAIED